MTTEMPDVHDFDLPEAELWDRQPGEPTKGHGAFRLYRDLPPYKRDLATVAEQVGISLRRAREWANEWAWRDRADAWDDACHRIEDQERIEAIREMHSTHRKAGRLALSKALQALQASDPERLPIASAIRLLELGAKLERSTLIVSVEELQGLEADDDETEDPWDRIARELDPAAAVPDL